MNNSTSGLKLKEIRNISNQIKKKPLPNPKHVFIASQNKSEVFYNQSVSGNFRACNKRDQVELMINEDGSGSLDKL